MAAVPSVTMSEGTWQDRHAETVERSQRAADAKRGQRPPASDRIGTSQPATTAARLAMSATEKIELGDGERQPKPSAGSPEKLVSRSTFTIFAGEAKFGRISQRKE